MYLVYLVLANKEKLIPTVSSFFSYFWAYNSYFMLKGF